MAQQMQPNTARPASVGQVAAPQHTMTPTPRELRAQAVHRLQVGLFGLATMLLLVGLANIIMDRARLAENTAVAVDSKGRPVRDTLADIGVAPAAEPSAAPATTAGK